MQEIQMKKRLYILAPNDRFNYGDLLFPYIIKFYFSGSFDEIVYVSTTKSDLSSKGGFKTEKQTILYDINPTWENHLIVAGGESLCAQWFNILSFVNPWINFINKLSRKISKNTNRRCEAIIKLLFGYKTHYPFTIGKNEISHFKTISYNAVGGTFLKDSNELDLSIVRDILNSVDFFTVRDNITSTTLAKRKIEHCICPDSAILMDGVFSEKMLISNISISTSLIYENYIFFQGKPGHWDGNYELAASQLTELSRITNCKICLCPIGIALGHSDKIALYKIASLMEGDYFGVWNPNIFDIMWLIKHSKMYIGVSLHGAITAMSFNVPYIGYGSLKLKYYLEQWSDSKRFVEIDKIKDAAIEYFHQKVDSTRQKEIVKICFERLKLLYEK